MKTNTGVNASNRGGVSAASLVLAVMLFASGSSVQAQEPDAKAILKAMSNYVGSQ
jgi:hypothetical protein